MYTCDLLCTCQHFFGMNSLPAIRINRSQRGCTPHSICSLKTYSGSWWGLRRTKTGTTKSKATLSHLNKCKYIHRLFFFLYPRSVVGSAQVPQTSCVSAPLLPSTSYVSHQETEGPGRAGPCQGLPSPNLQICVLQSAKLTICSSSQQTAITTSPHRCGRKASWHFLYDTLSLFLSLWKQRK